MGNTSVCFQLFTFCLILKATLISDAVLRFHGSLVGTKHYNVLIKQMDGGGSGEGAEKKMPEADA